MKISGVGGILKAEVLIGEGYLEQEVGCVIASDLISDILVSEDERALLITGLVNIQIVRAADMIDLVAVAFVRGKNPQREILDYAAEMDLPLLRTDYTMYEACGVVYEAGLRPGDFYIDELNDG
jgi:predicted transcriptional regulator